MQLYQNSEMEINYDIEVLGKSDTRFKVRICGLQDESRQSIVAWIDKSLCCIWIWPMMKESQQFVIRLYNEPNIHHRYKEFDETILLSDKCSILDFYEPSWVKVKVHTKSGDFEGWTQNHCDNIYGSCEYGNPYIVH